ncbi:hypothetical protein FHL15_009180 [Xylaria flabelliformis]|uniref:Mid2 domain-containing protein n=1 Tax=Xylaria flabelliformis TaxID=2512241 RepID=A0A553HPM6_9PEZI|nr:hypothetical protein FHL15_009180 [Xylaria flabelliformis]
MDNLGPLPTDFTINANCASEINDAFLLHTSIDNHDFYYLLRGPLAQTTCYPSGYAANTEQYYSPGRCPTGYTAPYTGHPWETTQGCVSTFTTTSARLTLSEVSDGITSRATTTFGDADAINAYSIQVRYQSTDFVSSSTSSPTPVSSAAIETHSPTNTPHSTNSNANKAIPGIVVGVLAAVFIAVGAVFLLVRRRRRHRRQQQQSNPTEQTQHPYSYPSELGDQVQQQQYYFGQFKVNPDNPQELDAPGRIAELDSGVAPPRDRG